MNEALRSCRACSAPIVGRGRTAIFCEACAACAWQSKDRANSLVAQAIRRGELPPVKGRLCVDCGCGARDYDHRDYRTPLVVDPVCHSCNRKRGPGAPFNSGNFHHDSPLPA